MFGLVDYESDGESEGPSEGQREQQQAMNQPSTAVTSQAATSSAQRITLPDATSLFASAVDSSMPWKASRPSKRISGAVQAPPAKSARTAASATASTFKQHKQTASGLLLPPQLQGRANASTEDLERIGFVKGRFTKKKQGPFP
ncbi:hypothetical protein ABBQ38_012494 [Trebouxia sp. C0009 RCD-2024]